MQYQTLIKRVFLYILVVVLAVAMIFLISEPQPKGVVPVASGPHTKAALCGLTTKYAIRGDTWVLLGPALHLTYRRERVLGAVAASAAQLTSAVIPAYAGFCAICCTLI